MKLSESLISWGNPEFETAFKNEVQRMDKCLLFLQAGLAQSSYVSDSDIDVVIMQATEAGSTLQVKAGIFYSGIIAGSCCSDDPTPVCEQNEYCEVLFTIDKQNAEAVITLLKE